MMSSLSPPQHPIGIFDSGVGGLTVLKQLIKHLPEEQYIYFGDTARLPYGEKSQETIIRYSHENAAFLLEHEIKLLIIACSTASAVALESLQNSLQIPVFGMIDPGAESVVEATKSCRVAVLGTRGTIKSQSYQRAILKLDPGIKVFQVPCPLFVPFVEEQMIDHPAAKLIVQEYLKPVKDLKVDTVLLGCTHYPLLKELIISELGDAVTVIDPAVALASQISIILASLQLNKEEGLRKQHRFFVSDDPEKFQRLGQAFLGDSINHVEHLTLLPNRIQKMVFDSVGSR